MKKMNNVHLTLVADSLPPIAERGFLDVDVACTKWLLEHDPEFVAMHDFFNRSKLDDRERGEDV